MERYKDMSKARVFLNENNGLISAISAIICAGGVLAGGSMFLGRLDARLESISNHLEKRLGTVETSLEKLTQSVDSLSSTLLREQTVHAEHLDRVFANLLYQDARLLHIEEEIKIKKDDDILFNRARFEIDANPNDPKTQRWYDLGRSRYC